MEEDSMDDKWTMYVAFSCIHEDTYPTVLGLPVNAVYTSYLQ
jgi:hypothetical protein